MVSQPPPAEVGIVAESLAVSDRVAQLEAEIAQLKEALARRQQIGIATGLLAQRFSITPERAWSLLVRLSQNGHVKVRDIAEAMINAHSGRMGPAETEILNAIEKHLPDGVRLLGAQGDSQQPSSENPSD
jgi:ANTAR domain